MKAEFDYEEYKNKIDEIKKKYPFLIKYKIGASVCARDIYALSVGNYKNTVLFVAGLSAKDALAVQILIKYTENVCHAFKNRTRISGINISSILMTKGLSIIPCLNVDGMEIRSKGKAGAGDYAEFVECISKGDYSKWEANAKGIDISRNFNSSREKITTLEVEKGVFGPAPHGYGGFAAESEPETRALVNFCERNNVHHAISLRGSSKSINWQSHFDIPENSKTIAKVLSVCCGYGIVNSQTDEECGSFKEWFCENFSRSALSFGVKNGQSIEETYKSLEEMLVIGTII